MVYVKYKEWGRKMAVLSMVVLGASDTGNMRIILFVLLIGGVVLILTGCFIALMTLRKRLKVHDMENERL